MWENSGLVREPGWLSNKSNEEGRGSDKGEVASHPETPGYGVSEEPLAATGLLEITGK
jgi:hypothetical protein